MQRTAALPAGLHHAASHGPLRCHAPCSIAAMQAVCRALLAPLLLQARAGPPSNDTCGTLSLCFYRPARLCLGKAGRVGSSSRPGSSPPAKRRSQGPPRSPAPPAHPPPSPQPGPAAQQGPTGTPEQPGMSAEECSNGERQSPQAELHQANPPRLQVWRALFSPTCLLLRDPLSAPGLAQIPACMRCHLEQ